MLILSLEKNKENILSHIFLCWVKNVVPITMDQILSCFWLILNLLLMCRFSSRHFFDDIFELHWIYLINLFIWNELEVNLGLKKISQIQSSSLEATKVLRNDEEYEGWFCKIGGYSDITYTLLISISSHKRAHIQDWKEGPKAIYQDLGS